MAPSQTQLKITLAEGEYRTIEALVREGWRRDMADAGLDCFRRGLPFVMAEYLQGKPIAESGGLKNLRTATVRMAAGEWIEESELAEVAHDADVSLDVLLAMRECLAGSSSTGGRAHVHNH